MTSSGELVVCGDIQGNGVSTITSWSQLAGWGGGLQLIEVEFTDTE